MSADDQRKRYQLTQFATARLIAPQLPDHLKPLCPPPAILLHPRCDPDRIAHSDVPPGIPLPSTPFRYPRCIIRLRSFQFGSLSSEPLHFRLFRCYSRQSGRLSRLRSELLVLPDLALLSGQKGVADFFDLGRSWRGGSQRGGVRGSGRRIGPGGVVCRGSVDLEAELDRDDVLAISIVHCCCQRTLSGRSGYWVKKGPKRGLAGDEHLVQLVFDTCYPAYDLHHPAGMVIQHKEL